MKNPTLLVAIALIGLSLTFSCKEEYEINCCCCDGDIPISDFIVSDTIVNQNTLIYFNDISENNPDSWEWEFEGGTPSSSSDQDPIVSYENSGIYNVTLKTSNEYGEDEIVKTEVVIIIPSDNMVANYSLDSDFEDISGNDLDASNSEVIFSSTDLHQGAYFEEGSYLYVANNDLLNFGTDDFSVSLWINTSSTTSQMIFQKGGLSGGADAQYWLRLNDEYGNITFLTGSGDYNSLLTSSSDSYEINTDEWYHIVTVREGETLKLYVNSELISEISGTILDTDSDQDLKFGSQIQTEQTLAPFIGYMNEIRMYNKALSIEEVELLSYKK